MKFLEFISDYTGKPLLVNAEHIISVYPDSKDASKTAIEVVSSSGVLADEHWTIMVRGDYEEIKSRLLSITVDNSRLANNGVQEDMVFIPKSALENFKMQKVSADEIGTKTVEFYVSVLEDIKRYSTKELEDHFNHCSFASGCVNHCGVSKEVYLKEIIRMCEVVDERKENFDDHNARKSEV